MFAAAARAVEGRSRVKSTAEIREIRVFGDWAYCWNQLTLQVRTIDSGEATQLTGPALSVLLKQFYGRWVTFRDANLVGPASH